MKRFLTLFITLLTLGIVFAGCDALSGDDEGGLVTLEGQVLNASTNNPVPNAFITILPYNLLFETDAEGRFSAAVEIDSTMNLNLRATKDGFGSQSNTVLALAGRTVEVPTFRLNQTASDKPVSGKASNILLLKQSSQSIGVKESGSEEVAQITFQVADSLGRPVILNQSADVKFTLGEQPGGGEFIFPAAARTDNNGQVTVNLSSGTRAGVVQVVAEALVEGRRIRSLPVSVAIHGGLPEQLHFSLGPARYNFPGLRTFGIINPVSVVVGDKYGNPVKEGTAVYFTTTHGVIEGSVLTNKEGRGTVKLISANPLPSDGIGIITASTADENQNKVSDQIPVIFSGLPVVRIEPAVARLNQTYKLTITDGKGNPLVEGTVVSVRVEGTKVKATGNTQVVLDDTGFAGGMRYEHVRRGTGITEFMFRAVPDLRLDEEGEPAVETITVTVRGLNGSIEIVLPKEGAAFSARRDVQLERQASGVVARMIE